MRYIFVISWRHSWIVCRLYSKECLSVCQMVYFLSEIRLIQGYLQFWLRYLFELFWRLSWNVYTLFPNNYKFCVCLSVCQLAYFLTEIRQIQGYLLFLMKYLSELVQRHSWDICALYQSAYKFLVWLSVHKSAYFLTEITQIQGYLLFLMIYLSESFWRHSCGVCTLVPNTYKFWYVCQSISWLTNLLKLGQYGDIPCSG